MTNYIKMSSKQQIILLLLVASQLQLVQLASVLSYEQIDSLPMRGEHGKEEIDELREWFDKFSWCEDAMVYMDNVAKMIRQIDESDLCTKENYELIEPNFQVVEYLDEHLMQKTKYLAEGFNEACDKKLDQAKKINTNIDDFLKEHRFSSQS